MTAIKKTNKIIKQITTRQLLLILSILATASLLYSCSKDNEDVPKKYLLRGTWQLYKQTSGGSETIYQLSKDNQIIFTPQIVQRYSGGQLMDSTTYSIKVDEDSPELLSGELKLDYGNPIALSIKADTLILSPSGFITTKFVYIKTQ